MHDLGDGLVNAGLRDPVLDVDRLEISYRDTNRLFADLTAAGARNSLTARPPGLTGRGRFAAMSKALGDGAEGEGFLARSRTRLRPLLGRWPQK